MDSTPGLLSKTMQSPIQIHPPTRNAGSVKFNGILQKHTSPLIVWWYGPLRKNSKVGTVPLVDVLFRTVHPDRTLGGPVIIPAGLTHLGTLRPGTIWSAGEHTGQILHSTLPETEVSFDRGSWAFVCSQDAGFGPNSRYKLPIAQNGSWLIELKSKSGLKILVPCVEFFIRCYGQTSETSRILSTYTWREAQERFFHDGFVDKTSQKIKLKHNIRTRDAVFLAHALHDTYTKAICQNIYAQLEANFETPPEPYRIPRLKIGPWFEGIARIEGNGVWLENDKVFLLLDITGLSEPAGPEIEVERIQFTSEGEDSGKRGYTKPPPSTPLDKRVDITDSDTPDSDTPRIVYAPPFRTLGEKRIIITTQKKISAKNGTPNEIGPDDKPLSTGDADGKNKGTAKGVFVSEDWGPHGLLADMWHSCVALGKSCSEISKVEWFTFRDGFQADSTPRYEFFKPFNDPDIPKDMKSWVYLYPKEKFPRGALIISLTIGRKTIYIIEIERRIYGLSDKNKNKEPSEVRYCGLIVDMPNSFTDRENELKLILERVKNHQGRIFRRTISNYRHETFIHKPYDPSPDYFKRLLLAKLAHLGIYLEASTKESTLKELTLS